MVNQSLAERKTVKPEQKPQSEPAAWNEPWPRSNADFERLIEAFQDRLVRYAISRLGRRNEAEDVVQDVFVRAYMRSNQDRGVQHVSSYLYRMTANACTDALRKRWRSGIRVPVEYAENVADSRPGPAADVAAIDELRRFEALVGRLPRRQAEVVRLRLLGELRFAEIAQVVGRSTATVKSRFRYGLHRLRTMIRKDWEAPS